MCDSFFIFESFLARMGYCDQLIEKCVRKGILFLTHFSYNNIVVKDEKTSKTACQKKYTFPEQAALSL